MKRLIMLAASARMKSEPKEPIPAIERYTGVFFRVLNKHLDKKLLSDTDIIIISSKLGVIKADERVPYIQPTKSHWGILDIKSNLLNDARSRNLERLRELTRDKEYDEVYVNVGKQYLLLIEGFEKIIKHKKIIMAQGAGLGPKARHMKEWLMSCSFQT